MTNHHLHYSNWAGRANRRGRAVVAWSASGCGEDLFNKRRYKSAHNSANQADKRREKPTERVDFGVLGVSALHNEILDPKLRIELPRQLCGVLRTALFVECVLKIQDPLMILLFVE